MMNHTMEVGQRTSDGARGTSLVLGDPARAEVSGPQVVGEAEAAMRRYADERTARSGTAHIPRWRLLLALTKQTLKNAPHVRGEAGLSVWGLFKDGWRTCTRERCWPAGYYKFKLYRPDRRPIASRFVHEQTGLFVMRDLNDADDVAVLDDKLEFAAACTRLGLPHVETVAYFKDGEVVERAGTGTGLPAEDLFIKSTNLLCGRGVQRWRYDRQSGRYRREGLLLTAAELFEHIRQMSQSGVRDPWWKRARSYIPKLGYELEREDRQPRPYIIQRELKNHPAMERFTNGSLCTVRVVTARAADGEPQLITAVLRMPTGSSSVDNFAAGGLASPIDLKTGRLGAAVYKDPRKPDLELHPNSGERIASETVPSWSEVLALSLRAHRSFPKVATVGWDVALTTEGPKLIEANPGWCVEVVQMAHGEPLGATAWPKLLMTHAELAGTTQIPERQG
ncbi:sugar-transfer associated ATP-grasp domain-containing protein [uncultured Sphingomonas sp.]|uniref:sugar-transfer associated ATP-grasp domain-containing protein n=1 Tax=uncultured Sphingomonas sp. TaxID=158754 RepID=UPI0025E831C4|nr:sugar-transfer associated ATP-grasp domain-containing protein [uncultured Sphingomonas sp.]